MKVTKLVLVAVMLAVMGITGCASTHENVAEHHHHPKAQFDGKCAYSVENGKYDVEGNSEFNLAHNGVTYYFSSASARDKFKDHIDQHVTRANRAWEGRSGR
ncbi:MAG: hypothetical protein KGQ59_00020 [Bdellovibrionales bacterium]|nr:hypothetical protein [Bdellovibrionales bacterium]